MRSWQSPDSVERDAAGLDRPGPALDLGFDETGEVVRRAAILGRDHDADALVALDHRRGVDGVARRLGELVDGRLRRALGKREAAPGAAVETFDAELVRGRDVLQSRAALEAERRIGLHGPALDLRGG